MKFDKLRLGSDNAFACLLVVTQITAVLLAFALAYFL